MNVGCRLFLPHLSTYLHFQTSQSILTLLYFVVHWNNGIGPFHLDRSRFVNLKFMVNRCKSNMFCPTAPLTRRLSIGFTNTSQAFMCKVCKNIENYLQFLNSQLHMYFSLHSFCKESYTKILKNKLMFNLNKQS